MGGKAEVRFTIPDLPAKQQIKMIKDMMFVVRSFEKLAPNEPPTDLTEMENAIKKLEAQDSSIKKGAV